MTMRKNPKRDLKRFDLEEVIDKPDFVAQTPNGTAKAFGVGVNKQVGTDSPWGPYPNGFIEPGGPWQPGRSNRTGE